MELTPRIKVWLDDDRSSSVFGDGRHRLLLEVDRQGSLSAAAETLNISYRKAWGDLKKAEQRLGLKLIDKSRGGAAGGSTTLTPQGRKLVAAYSRFRKNLEACLNDIYSKDFEKQIDDSG